jgi:hypothetical protein
MVYDIRSAEQKRQTRKVLIIRLSIFFCVCLVLLGLSVWLSQLRSVQIDTVTISGATVLPVQDLEKEAQRVLVGKYWFMFPKTNVFLYPQKEVEHVLSEKFPRIQTFSSAVVDNHILSITVTEREPFALWCDTIPTTTVIPQCYFLDKNGFVFDHAPQFSGDAYFKYYGILPYEAPIGSYYLSSTTRFHELSKFVETAKTLNITPLYISAKDQNSFELYVFGGGKILFDGTENMVKVSDRLSALLKTQNLVPREEGALLVDYIDLRFGNKMFFKPKAQ